MIKMMQQMVDSIADGAGGGVAPELLWRLAAVPRHAQPVACGHHTHAGAAALIIDRFVLHRLHPRTLETDAATTIALGQGRAGTGLTRCSCPHGALLVTCMAPADQSNPMQYRIRLNQLGIGTAGPHG